MSTFKEVIPAASPPLGNWLDGAIGAVAPQWHARRIRARLTSMALSQAHALRTRIDRGWPKREREDLSRRRTPGEQTDLADRGWDLLDNNAIADGLISRAVENVVGTGITVQAATKDEGWNRAAEAIFERWWLEEADVRGMSDGYELQEHILRAFLVGGDSPTVLLASGQLQVLEGGLISTPMNLLADPAVVEGVRLSVEGRPEVFYVASTEPPGTLKHEEVAARDMIFWARRRRISDTRGRSVFSNTARYFDQIDANIEAVIAACQMAAMVGLLIKTEDHENLARLGTTPDAQGVSRPAYQMEPGMVQYLGTNEDAQQINPTQPATNWPDFVKLLLRILGLPLGLPLELMLLDFSNTNYSSARASLLQAYRAFMRLQRSLINNVLNRIWRWRISKFIQSGDLSARPDAWSCKWIPPGWPWVDPVKEVVGNLIAVDAGLATLRDVAAGQGNFWLDLLQQRELEIKELAARGIPLVQSRQTRPSETEAPAAKEPDPGEESGDGGD